jgi:uncharacterized protein (DUF302 family)
MMRKLAVALAFGAALLAGGPAGAEEWRAYSVDAAYDDVMFDLQTAIEGRGYVIDNVSHVGEMLNRTAADVGATMQVYDHAEVYQFCSAVLSRKMMEADPMNIAFCPYGIFLFQKEGESGVTIGYRRMPEGTMQEVDALLDEIVREVAGVQ